MLNADTSSERVTHVMAGLFKDQFRTAQTSNSMASAERKPITGGGGSGGRAAGGGQGGRSPPKAECFFLFLRVQTKP